MGVTAPPKRGTAPQLSVHVCCSQTAGWTKTPLGTEVDLRPGHTVLGSQLSANGAQQPPSFGRMCDHGRPSQLLLSSCINSFNLNVAIHCFAQCGRLKVSRNVSVSALQGLGLGLVSWQKSGVSVSSRSRGIAGRSWSRSRLRPKTECLGLVS